MLAQAWVIAEPWSGKASAKIARQSEAFKRRRTGWVTRLQGLQAGIPQEHETRGGTLARVPTVDRRRTAVYLRTTDASRCAIINLPANSAEILATLARLQVPIETECRGE